MVIALALAAAIWRSGTVIPLVVVVVALSNPPLALLVVLGWVAWHRYRDRLGPSPDDEAVLLGRLVAELEGGASPRSALRTVTRTPSAIDLGAINRMVEAGVPASDIAVALRSGLPHNGSLVAAAWALAGEAGAPAAPVMASLASRAAERGRLDRERLAATAQARATAWVIAGLPLAVIIVLGATGRIGSGPSLPIVVVGVGLQVAGLAIAFMMLRRAT